MFVVEERIAALEPLRGPDHQLRGGWVARSYRRDLKDRCLFFSPLGSPKIDDMRSRGGGGGEGEALGQEQTQREKQSAHLKPG